MMLRWLPFPCVALLLSCSVFQGGSTEDRRLSKYFAKQFDISLKRSPELATSVGSKLGQDSWNEISERVAKKDLELAKKRLADLESFDIAKLSHDFRQHLAFYKVMQEWSIVGHEFRYYDFLFNQMFGLQSDIPSFLINFHRVASEQDLKDYIRRVQKIRGQLENAIQWSERGEKQGIALPFFAAKKSLADTRKLLATRPLVEDFADKLLGLSLPQDKAQALTELFEKAHIEGFETGYKVLEGFLSGVVKRAKKYRKSYWGAAWQLPQGSAFYKASLRYHTTTKMTPKQIHHYGLQEVARIQGEMRRLMPQLGHKTKSLKGFFRFVQNSSSQYFEQTSEGRNQYLQQTKQAIGEAKKIVGRVLKRPPRYALKVKPVEKYREESAGIAFYTGPSEDGERPGIYYVNLYDLKKMPKYALRALAFHEGIPGHHLQIALLQEMENLPRFRKVSAPNAYTEGWGLYAESLADELNLYPGPWDQFGRLSMELLRAVRLVVDTGLHEFRWTPEEAVKYFTANTEMSAESARKSVERYLVLPGQATSYKIGMRWIQQTRQVWSDKQRTAGKKADPRVFHDWFLGRGPLPLEILDRDPFLK